MTLSEVTAAKAKIDSDLVGKSDNVGIAFGKSAYDAFVKAGHIQKRAFGLLGTTLFADMLPAYGNSHFSYLDWELQMKDVKVGG